MNLGTEDATWRVDKPAFLQRPRAPSMCTYCPKGAAYDAHGIRHRGVASAVSTATNNFNRIQYANRGARAARCRAFVFPPPRWRLPSKRSLGTTFESSHHV